MVAAMTRSPSDASAPAWRCFVALQPDAAAASALDALTDRLLHAMPGSRRVVRADLHLTLAFIGALTPIVATRIAARLAQRLAMPFCWRIDRLGRFASARVAWAAGPVDRRLSALADDTRCLLDAEGIGYDRRAFVPHVTLLRSLPAHARLPDDAVSPAIEWMVSAPRLLRSAGGHYRDVAEQPLQPAQHGPGLAGINRKPEWH